MIVFPIFSMRAVLAVSLLLLVLPSCRERQPETQRPRPGPVSQDRRFSGSVRLRSSTGPQEVRVEITNVDLRGGSTIDRLELPFEGTLMVNLQAGEVTTTIDGKKEERHQGQIWTVPPGVPMGLTTGRDAASLQTILVER